MNTKTMKVGCKSSTRHKAVLSKERTAYFAGLIDGEGYVTLSKNQDRVVPIWNVPTIVVAMTHLDTIQACKNYFRCGSVHVKNYRNGKWKTVYGWTVRWNDARFVAAAIRPFSITKSNDLDRIINLPIQKSGPKRKLDEKTIRRIRRSYKGSYSKLGKQFNIATMTAWKIVNRKLYVDIK